MGVRLRTTLTATAAVAVALCLASIALFAVLDASLADTTKELALQDAKARAVQRGVLTEKLAPGQAGEVIPPGTPAAPEKGTSAGAGWGWVTGSGAGSGTGSGTGSGSAGTGSAGTGAGADAGSGSGTGSGSGSASGGGVGSDAGPGADPGEPPPLKVGFPGLGGMVDYSPKNYVSGKGFEGKLVVTEVYPSKNGPVAVKGTASLAPARQAMRTLTHVLIPGVPALLALVALFTWLAVGRVLRPVSAIRAKVAEITAHDLHERVPEPRTHDEIAALARTVNATLDRLRTAVDAHRQFVADAAHELRSPMAILRTRLELARPQEKALAAEALDDVARLQSLTSDLLLLSRLDARQPLRAQELDLAQLVAEEAARRRPRLEIRVVLRLTPDVLVHGSPDHLRRLVANLVDNAVRHATSTVTVTLARSADADQGPRAGRALERAVLDVTDDGEGIPAEYRATVFDRFTRLDAARPRDTGGSGLGLPIARDIATAHGGTLTVRPAPPGTGARLRAVFPLGPSASAPAAPTGPTAVPTPAPTAAPAAASATAVPATVPTAVPATVPTAVPATAVRVPELPAVSAP